MPRLERKVAVLLKLETTSGVDAVPTGAANAMYVSELSVTPLDATNIPLDYIRPYFGNSPNLVGSASKKCSFKVYLAGAGTAATAPAWSAAFVACANAETTGLTVPNRVEWLPATDSLKTATIYYHDDGVLHKLTGAFGMWMLSAKSGEAPYLKFDFIGVDSGDTAVANPTTVLTAWREPVPVTKANVVDIKLGCTYATGVLTGGTVYNTSGLTLESGNAVAFAPLLTTEAVVLTDRKVKGKVSFDLTAAQEVANMATVKNNVIQGLGFELGLTTGNRIMLFMPAVQLINPTKEVFNGQRMIAYDLQVNPVAGNDELRIISL